MVLKDEQWQTIEGRVPGGPATAFLDYRWLQRVQTV